MGGRFSKGRGGPSRDGEQGSKPAMAMMGDNPVSAEQAAKYAAMNGVKRALLCGCNYMGTKAELLGCVNDVHNWDGLLKDCFGFSEKEVTVLVDHGGKGKYEKPTGKAIKDNLKRLVDVSQPGDMVFFQFSGHGVQVSREEGWGILILICQLR